MPALVPDNPILVRAWGPNAKADQHLRGYTAVKPQICPACQRGDCVRVTGKPEVIGSSSGLVPTNAYLVSA